MQQDFKKKPIPTSQISQDIATTLNKLADLRQDIMTETGQTKTQVTNKMFQTLKKLTGQESSVSCFRALVKKHGNDKAVKLIKEGV